MLRLHLWVRAFIALFLLIQPVLAEEVIQSFDSSINLAKDGVMTVTETIAVNAEGNQIRRGILRDFPLVFTDEQDRVRKVDFDIVSIKRDGQNEPYRTTDIRDGIRIVIGSPDVVLTSGQHVYAITYQVDREIRYFPDHEELYWNVTGNGSIFRIIHASATVTLPQGVRPNDTTFFTGGYGATEKNARVSGNNNVVRFETTSPLASHENLSIGISMPKGSIAQPRNKWFWSDNRDYFFAIGGLLVVFLYYTWAWMKVGRDPARGVIVPRWDAPAGVSPALVSYIDNKGFSGGGWSAISAAFLDLAVRGFVRLENADNSLIIHRTSKPLDPWPLQAGEQNLLQHVSDAGETFEINKMNGLRVKSMGMAFRQAMEKDHSGQYYQYNVLYVLGGVALSALALFVFFLFGNISDEKLIVSLMTGGILAAVLAIFGGFIKTWSRTYSVRKKINLVISSVIATFVCLVFLSIFFSFGSSIPWQEILLLSSAGGILLLNVLYFFLIGAPTQLGTRMMDHLDGLRQYLTLAEKDRMNMAGAPQMSPTHFETMLPFAVALGVEKPWSSTFENWLASATHTTDYRPAWYYGSFDHYRFAESIGDVASSMADTMESTIPKPKSSSKSSAFSSRGGFSGGGGGGGGVGGW